MTVKRKVRIVIAFILAIKKPLMLLALEAFIKWLSFNLFVLLVLEISGHKQCYKHMHK